MVALRSAGILDRLGSKLAPALPRWMGRPGESARAADSGGPAEPPIRPRRSFGATIRHLPQMLRALVRTDEIWLSVLASFVGVVAGLCVVAMTLTTQWAHRILFLLGPHERLSGQAEIEPLRAVLVPSVGGIAVGLLALAVIRYWPRRAVDPIEANALYGGRMSLNDSLIVVAQTMLSNSVGASVGLEAGYTQIGAALASRFGRLFKVRRNDLRLLVGCGAAGAIAAAFNAPLTGAFYAFELVIGTYSLATLAPVVVAAISAVAVVRALIPEEYVLDIRVPGAIEASAYAPMLLLGIICAFGGILIMRGVTVTEELFRRSKMPTWLRPGVGGLAVGVMALLSPQVLSSGHAALQVSLDAPYTLSHIAILILLKSVASAVSLGSGFRGGLFFASLFLGALVGKLFAAAIAAVAIAPAIPTVVCALVGMSALAVAVVGGPLTMAFLTLEATGSLPLTVAVVAAAVLSALTVRRTFGYSFATWRFHLRGEAIRSAVDIGWVRALTVARMMRREFRTVRGDTPISTFVRDVPLGAASRAVALDENGIYLGMVQVPEAHTPDSRAKTVHDILHHQDHWLLPQMTIKDAVELFETAEADALVVVDGPETRRVIGLLTEQYALRRYSEELDRRRRDISGE